MIIRRIAFCFLALLFPAFAFAKNISLYDQPTADAKIVGTVDLSSGIIPIFTPKDSNWIKIGDPRNGNVGWVQTKDISNTTSTTFTFTQRVIEHGKNSQPTYQVIQFGQPNRLTPEQTQEMVKKIQAQQREMQQSFQKTMQNLMKMNAFFDDNSFPVFMPVIIMQPQPQQNQKATLANKPKS